MTLDLTGLDGSNPLAFLAALGTLRVLDASTDPDEDPIRLSWTDCAGTFVPRVHIEATPNDLLDRLEASLVTDYVRHDVSIRDRLMANDGVHPTLAELIANASVAERTHLEWAAVFRADEVPPDQSNQLQIVRSDYFRGNLVSVIANTTREHLRRTLFDLWDYADALDNQSLHWDPSEDRRHAYQWSKPSGDPTRKYSGGMLGANRLAIESLWFFPTVPENAELWTLGFSHPRARPITWTWPIWSAPLTVPVVRSILTLPTLRPPTSDSENLNREKLTSQGIVASYEVQRILVGKTPNLTPSIRII